MLDFDPPPVAEYGPHEVYDQLRARGGALIREGRSFKSIAEELGVCTRTVRNWADRIGARSPWQSGLPVSRREATNA